MDQELKKRNSVPYTGTYCILSANRKIYIMNWLKGKRVFSRWKLIAMILIGVWVGFMAALGEYIFAAIYGLLGIWELTKKS